MRLRVELNVENMNLTEQTKQNKTKQKKQKKQEPFVQIIIEYICYFKAFDRESNGFTKTFMRYPFAFALDLYRLIRYLFAGSVPFN